MDKKKCIICKKNIKSKKYNVCSDHYGYSDGRVCLTCGKFIQNKNKTNYCNKHRDRTGKNNPFYGKKHSNNTKSIIAKKTKILSIEKWKNKDYREKVIKMVSKPRNPEFGIKQSNRVKKWYKENPEQRLLRSNNMKELWRNGKIISNKKKSFNRSKIEKDFFTQLYNIYPFVYENQTLKTVNGNILYPDAFIPDRNCIIEFFGDYWHANPRKYKPNDIVHHGLKAKDIWKNDAIRTKKFSEILINGKCVEYYVVVIWEYDYKHNKESILNYLNSSLNWDSCSDYL